MTTTAKTASDGSPAPAPVAASDECHWCHRPGDAHLGDHSDCPDGSGNRWVPVAEATLHDTAATEIESGIMCECGHMHPIHIYDACSEIEECGCSDFSLAPKRPAPSSPGDARRLALEEAARHLDAQAPKASRFMGDARYLVEDLAAQLRALATPPQDAPAYPPSTGAPTEDKS